MSVASEPAEAGLGVRVLPSSPGSTPESGDGVLFCVEY